jgi:ABC-type transporter Mla MlaB component
MSTPFELPEEMTIYSAVETRDALLAWVTEQNAKSSKLLEVSAAKVREIDGSGLQLLAALANMDQPWQLLAPSTAFVDACNALGLSAWLPSHSAHS